MRRRDLIVLMGGTVVAVSLDARAQQQVKPRRIAYLGVNTRVSAAPYVEAFREGMRALGYSDEDIIIEERFADGHSEHLPDLAAELVRLVLRLSQMVHTADRSACHPSGRAPLAGLGPVNRLSVSEH